MFQVLTIRYCLSPANIQIEEIAITNPSNIIKASPNSSSFSRMVKNDGWVNKNIDNAIAIGANIKAEMETPFKTVLIFDICSIKPSTRLKISVLLVVISRFSLRGFPIINGTMNSSIYILVWLFYVMNRNFIWRIDKYYFLKQFQSQARLNVIPLIDEKVSITTFS